MCASINKKLLKDGKEKIGCENVLHQKSNTGIASLLPEIYSEKIDFRVIIEASF